MCVLCTFLTQKNYNTQAEFTEFVYVFLSAFLQHLNTLNKIYKFTTKLI